MEVHNVCRCLLVWSVFVNTAVNFGENSEEFADHLTDEDKDLLDYLLEVMRNRIRSKKDFMATLSEDLRSSSTENKARSFTNNYDDSMEIQSAAGTIITSKPCEETGVNVKTCIYYRQVGTAITFGVSFKRKTSLDKIHWFRVYKLEDSGEEAIKEMTEDHLPWNIFMGGEYNNELRIFPLTYTDMDYNSFVALAEDGPNGDFRTSSMEQAEFIRFRIMQIFTDTGYVYPGEELVINVRQFIDLPWEGIKFHWNLGDTKNMEYLPSNMKVSPDESIVYIKELRNPQDNILACAMYSSAHYFVARKGFLLRKTEKVPVGSAIYRSSHNYGNSFKRRKRSVTEPLGSQKEHNFQNIVDDSELHPVKKIVYELFYSAPVASRRIHSNLESEYQNRIPMTKIWPEDKNRRSYDDFSADDMKINPELFYSNAHKPVESFSFKTATLESVPEGYFFPGKVLPQYDTNMAQQFSPADENQRQNAGQYDVAPMNDKKLTFDDEESALINHCWYNFQCSRFATCIQRVGSPGFCKCKEPSQGNGVFCWML